MIKKTLYFGNPTYLSLRHKQIEVRMPEVENAKNLTSAFKESAVRTIPIEDVGIIILDHSQICITNALVSELQANNVALLSCDNTHMPLGMMLPLYSNSLQSERFNVQWNSTLTLRKNLWQQTIKAKIANQAALLKTRGVKVGNMLAWVEDVKTGDKDNLEARAAVYYWQNLFSDYPNFVRGQDETFPNPLLNYGYAILRAIVARSLVAVGLHPTIGIFHHNRYNPYCLADDIMEPYRPYVDKIILRLLAEKKCTELSTDAKREILMLAYTDVIINGNRSPLSIATNTTALSLFKCFSGESRKILFPILT